jgi:hypothetical protein
MPHGANPPRLPHIGAGTEYRRGHRATILGIYGEDLGKKYELHTIAARVRVH